MSEFCARVTNNNSFPIIDHFAAVEYRFPPGKAVRISLDAAQHMFGFDPDAEPGSNANYMQMRWGWNTPKTVDCAKEWLANIEIEAIAMRTVEVPPELTAEQLDMAIQQARQQPPELPLA